jgi:hypothetical protein
MAKYVVTKDPDAYPAGSYRGHFIDWEPRDGDFGEYILWSFKVSHNDETQTVTGITGARFGTRTKEYGFVTALQGKAPQPGDDVNLGKLRGSPCTVELETKEGKNGVTYNSVVGVHQADASADTLDISEDRVPF